MGIDLFFHLSSDPISEKSPSRDAGGFCELALAYKYAKKQSNEFTLPLVGIVAHFVRPPEGLSRSCKDLGSK